MLSYRNTLSHVGIKKTVIDSAGHVKEVGNPDCKAQAPWGIFFKCQINVEFCLESSSGISLGCQIVCWIRMQMCCRGCWLAEVLALPMILKHSSLEVNANVNAFYKI